MTLPPIRHNLPQAWWLPQTLAARVFGVFSMTTFVGTVVGLLLLYYQQFSRHVEETRSSIGKVAEVALQPIADSAVVGDYDAIARLLHRMVPDSPLREALFIDATGASIHASNDVSANVPTWLVTLVARSVPDLQQEIAIGGHRYGQLVLRYDPVRVAGELWGLLLNTAGLAAVGLALSLAVMRYAMQRWLRTLDSLHELEAQVQSGTLDAQVTLMDDAPLEIRKAIEVVNRTAGSLRAQFGQRIDTLMHSLIQHKNAMDEAAIVCELDPEGCLTAANEGFLAALGLPLSDLQGRTLQDIDHSQAVAGTKPTSESRDVATDVWRPSKNIWRGEVAVANALGAARVHRRSVVPIFNAAGAVEKYICIDFDVTAQKASEQVLFNMARFDGLTGLPNRGLLFERLERALQLAHSQGTRVALMYLDLDRFKLVNDTLGHEAGDHLLVQAANRITTCLRASDTVARLAGDEFAVMLPGLDKRTDVEQVGRKVLAQLAQPFDLNGQEVFISASIGAAVYPDHALEPAMLLRCADHAMYHAKMVGRNELRGYNEEMNTREADRLEIGTRLRAALERQEFTLDYQPRVSLETGRISGMEALLRWTHPERGPMSPVDFVPVLEDTGLIIGVGEWVLREVAQQVLRWQSMGLGVPCVAVNLSARQFSSPEFEKQVRTILSETGVDPMLLEFELTESMLMHEQAQAVATLKQFRALGLRLSVDDFGTGYSSLSALRHFPLDALKVDRAFVRELATNSDDMAITLAIIRMAHSLKLKVVAEGVETLEQLNLLVDAGCDEIQGFYFSKPVSAQEMAHMLRDHRRLHAKAV